MMKANKLLIFAMLVFCTCLTAGTATAEVVTSLPGGTIIPMPGVNHINDNGPETFGPGILGPLMMEFSDLPVSSLLG